LELRGDGLVLVVDDEESVRFVAKRMLERAGFEVVTAAGGEEALRMFRERGAEIRAALVDMTMPGLDGQKTLVALRELDPGVPVVISSGYDAQNTNERLGDRKAPSAFIQKPYRSHDLVRCVLQAIDSAPGRRGAN
jgi:DNA-binding NtrC family response regulator